MPMLSEVEKKEAILLGDQRNWEGLLQRGKDAWNTWAENEKSKVSNKIPSIEFHSPRERFRKIALSDFRELTFPCSTLFKNIKFSNDVYFSESAFEESLNFSGCEFEGKSFFCGTNFRDLFLEEVTFHGEVDLSDAEFWKNTNISSTTFKSKTVFSRSTFHEELSLHKASFDEVVYFHRATFKESASFRSNFKGYTSFNQASFWKESDFNTSVFGGPIIFDEGQFRGSASFSNTNFENFTQFQGTEFHEETKFTKARIQGPLSFKPKTVKRQVSFSGAYFTEHADFSGTPFGDDVTFTDTNFEKSALFSDCNFQKEAIFLRTVFAGYTSFENARFSEKICPNFRSTVFLESRSPELYGTSIKYQVSDKCACHKIFNICKYDDGYERYRILKKLAAQNHNHDAEVYYFALEMKAKRHHLHKYSDLSKVPILALNHGYGLLSDFGQSIVRPLIGLILTALFFAYCYSGLLAQNWLDRLLLVANFDRAVWVAVTINLIPFAGQISIGRDSAIKQLCSNQTLLVNCPADLYIISAFEGFFAFLFLFLIGLALRNTARIK